MLARDLVNGRDFEGDRGFLKIRVVVIVFFRIPRTDIAFLEHIENMTPRHPVSSKYRSTLIGANIYGRFMAVAVTAFAAVFGTFEPKDASAYVLEGSKLHPNLS